MWSDICNGCKSVSNVQIQKDFPVTEGCQVRQSHQYNIHTHTHILYVPRLHTQERSGFWDRAFWRRTSGGGLPPRTGAWWRPGDSCCLVTEILLYNIQIVSLVSKQVRQWDHKMDTQIKSPNLINIFQTTMSHNITNIFIKFRFKKGKKITQDSIQRKKASLLTSPPPPFLQEIGKDACNDQDSTDYTPLNPSSCKVHII